MAFKLIIHAFRMIFGNLGQALKVSVGPYLILYAGRIALFAATGLLPVLMDRSILAAREIAQVNPLVGFVPFLMLPIAVFVTAWVAVSWHRFILLEEYSGILPTMMNRPIWPYAGKSILLGLLVIAVAIPGLLIGFVAANLSSFILLAVLLAILALSLRWGISLVGTALGKPMTFRAAWDATSKISGVVIGVAVILLLINTVPSYLIAKLLSGIPVIGFVLNVAINWLTMMLGLSILTTIYGHVIEDRPLAS